MNKFISAKFQVTSAIIKRKEEKKMKKLTDLFHVEQSKNPFRAKQYGEPTGQDIASAIVGAVLLVLLFAAVSYPL